MKLTGFAMALMVASAGAFAADERAKDWSDTFLTLTKSVYADTLKTDAGFRFSQNLGLARACDDKELADAAVDAAEAKLMYEVAQSIKRNKPADFQMSGDDALAVYHHVRLLSLTTSQGAEHVAANIVKATASPEKWQMVCETVKKTVRRDTAALKKWSWPDQAQ